MTDNAVIVVDQTLNPRISSAGRNNIGSRQAGDLGQVLRCIPLDTMVKTNFHTVDESISAQPEVVYPNLRKRPGQPYVRCEILNEHRQGKRSYHQFVRTTFTHDLDAAFGRIV